MVNQDSKTSDKQAHSSSSAKNIKLPKPPFSSPTKGKALKRFKIEQSSPHMIAYQRIGDKQNSYIVYVLRPNKDGGFIQPVNTIVTAQTDEGDKFRECTNALAPLVSRRISREDNSPMEEKSPQNLKPGKTNYPFRCLYCQKTDDIDHDKCIVCVMQLVRDIINENSKCKQSFVADVQLSDETAEGNRPFDHVITDKGIQTILYRYYFMDQLDENTCNEQKQIYELPDSVTKTFHANHKEIAHFFFSPHEGNYSAMAQTFGYPEKEQA